MSRQISGLSFARACARPSCIPKSRPRGKKAAGLRYERDLAAAAGGVHGQWFEFEDRAGHGWCQPDLFFESGGLIFVLEAKYTWTEAGHRQIEGLYRPVLSLALRKPVAGIVVCKVLTKEVHPSWLTRSLAEAMTRSRSGQKTVLHWIGAGLEPFRRAAGAAHLAPGLASL